MDWLGDIKQTLTGNDALINSVTLRYSYLRGYTFSSEKARRELGYEWGPLEPAIADALAWARRNGQL
jgi:nucleoside-diphosphate-sugar epimerase